MDKPKKNPHAVALGRIGGRKRKEKLTPDERSDIARKATNTRWAMARARAAAAAKLKPRAKARRRSAA